MADISLQEITDFVNQEAGSSSQVAEYFNHYWQCKDGLLKGLEQFNGNMHTPEEV